MESALHILAAIHIEMNPIRFQQLYISTLYLIFSISKVSIFQILIEYFSCRLFDNRASQPVNPWIVKQLSFYPLNLVATATCTLYMLIFVIHYLEVLLILHPHRHQTHLKQMPMGSGLTGSLSMIHLYKMLLGSVLFCHPRHPIASPP